VAGELQRWAIRLGLLTSLICGLTILLRKTGPISQMIVTGILVSAVLVVVSGIIWGFLWRSWVRAAFRRQYEVEERDDADA
jgi:hypothetical protein